MLLSIDMRLDKFLKVSRLIKRRELAKEFIEHNFVLLNDKEVKPSAEVKIGDKITIISPSKKITNVIIKEVRMISTIDNASNMYELLS